MIGLIGKKIGVTQVFGELGELLPVTVIAFSPNIVVAKKTKDKDGYNAVLVGVDEKKKSRISKPYAKQFPEGIAPSQLLSEMRDYEKDVEIGQKLDVSTLEGLRYVDAIATSKGKGFQGVVRRYHFGGGRATHGSKFHREPGSTGQSTYPHKTFKNVKMPGRMGRERVTVQNLKVIKIDKEKSFILVKGSVPGSTNSMVLIRAAVKKA